MLTWQAETFVTAWSDLCIVCQITVQDMNDVPTGVQVIKSDGSVLVGVDENLPKVSDRFCAACRRRTAWAHHFVAFDCPDMTVSLCKSYSGACALWSQGTVVGTLRAIDPDCCDRHRFSIVDGTKTFATQPGPNGTTQLVTILATIDFEAQVAYCKHVWFCCPMLTVYRSSLS